MSKTGRLAAALAAAGLAGLSLLGPTGAGAQTYGSNPVFGSPPGDQRTYGSRSNPSYGGASSGYINRQRSSGSGSSSAYDNSSGSGYQAPRAPAPTYQQPRSSSGSNSRPSYGYEGGSTYQQPKTTYGSPSCGYGSSRSRPTSGEAAADSSIWRTRRGTERGC